MAIAALGGPQLQEQRFVVDNGVRVLVEELPHVRSASLGFWVDTGTKNESAENNGISHFIEHMLFKGTKTRSPLAIAQALEDSGGSLNAFTDKEMTCYYARVLDDQVELAIDVLSDMLLNSLLDETELKREKRVILEEIKMYEDTPDELVQDMFSQAFWGDHPLGRAIVGTRQSIRRMTRDDLLAYIDRYYTPDRLVVSVAGNVRAAAVLRQLEATLGNLRRKAHPGFETPPKPLKAAKVKYKDIEQAHLVIGTQGLSVTDPDRFVLTVLDAILGGGMASRLFQEVREKRGLAYAISSFECLFHNAGIFGIYAATNAKNLETVIELSLAEVDKFKRGEIQQDELQRAKQQLRGSLLLSLESPRNRMSRMARNELYFGRMVSPTEVIDAIERVTLDDLQRVASALFQPGKLTTTVVGPIRHIAAIQ
ncbi:MAG: insulinase family protein [Cyanobacteria bacterium REEB65]|nr:insulinase family protein [Cyanobacteria bacterium REEB65]